MASSSSSRVWKYDVFLSFRGDDTRKTFLSHLYHGLVGAGIDTFKDDEKLERGKPLSPELLSAIEQSRFSIVVISENYASSGWCLDELAQIIECMDTTGLIVIPIFYGVDPAHVRNQKGSFEVAFQKHQERFQDDPEKVQRWREALTRVADMPGEHSKNWTDESMSIQKIVREISDKLNSLSSSVPSPLIGMDDQMNKVKRLLRLESNEVLMVGIWGMGGVGKTTLAEYVYKNLSSQFQCCCFMENVKDNFRKYDLPKLQTKFLSQILQTKDLKIWDSCTSDVIKERLRRKKALIVLDDVDKLEQVDALAKETNWFGLGSRIIITTRDKRLLIAHGVECVHEVQCLSHDKALQLFSQFAFKQKHPKHGFEKLSFRAAKYACGLPLALKVLGSSLYGIGKEIWESALKRLERTPKKDIMEVLRLSFSNLEEEDKTVFLYIACFFVGEEVCDVTRIIDSCGYSAELAINVLTEKSLIHIDWKRIVMHDLIQEMGEEIVRKQSIDEPGKCKILSDPMKIHNALISNTATGAVEKLKLWGHKLQSLPSTIWDLPDLRYLTVFGLNNLRLGSDKFGRVPSTRSDLPTVQGLHILGGKAEATPRFMCNETLEFPALAGDVDKVEMDGQNLTLYRIRYNPHGIPFRCFSFSSFSSLMSLRLDNLNILEIPDDLGHLCHLESLYLYGNDFKAIPESIINLSRLERLIIFNCRKLQLLPELPSNLKYLDASNCISLESMSPRSRCHLTELMLNNCFKLDQNTQRWIQNVANEESALVFLPKSVNGSTSYRFLMAKQLMDQVMPSFPAFGRLHLQLQLKSRTVCWIIL